ncbi:MAG: DUF1573 domain-containing protein [Bacteroidaceae bacterium]|nr:DUF1573 domain-containing protein [Bacteroidaceae bacterium]
MNKTINISPSGSLRSFLVLLLTTLWISPLVGESEGVFAQSIDAEFDVIDMGDITFQQPAQATFRMKNRGSEFFLKEVKPFCGCTQVTYPKKNIAKGENFTITVTYDAEMLGHFQKDIAMISDQFENPYYLTVKGNVVTNPITQSMEESNGAAVMIGKIMLSRDNVEFADTYQGDRIQDRITITNGDTKPINPQIVHVPQYMTAQITPNIIQPGKQGVITFTLNANMLPRYGLTQTSVYLAAFPGDIISKEKEILVTAIKLPSLQLSESQRNRVPVLTLSDSGISLDKALKGDLVLGNKGKSPLVISTIQSFTPGLNITLNKTTLSPGETTILRVKGTRKNLKDLDSKQQPRILIITNDPNNQKLILEVKYKL